MQIAKCRGTGSATWLCPSPRRRTPLSGSRNRTLLNAALLGGGGAAGSTTGWWRVSGAPAAGSTAWCFGPGVSPLGSISPAPSTSPQAGSFFAKLCVLPPPSLPLKEASDSLWCPLWLLLQALAVDQLAVVCAGGIACVLGVGCTEQMS